MVCTGIVITYGKVSNTVMSSLWYVPLILSLLIIHIGISCRFFELETLWSPAVVSWESARVCLTSDIPAAWALRTATAVCGKTWNWRVSGYLQGKECYYGLQSLSLEFLFFRLYMAFVIYSLVIVFCMQNLCQKGKKIWGSYISMF